MSRKEYMEQLSKALEGIEAGTAAEIMEDYEAHFERAKEAGRSEEEVIEELGSIEEFVQELGQFVQKGESVAEEPKQECTEQHVMEEKQAVTAEERSVQEDELSMQTPEQSMEEAVPEAEAVSGEVVEEAVKEASEGTQTSHQNEGQEEYHREYRWGQNRENQNESSWEQNRSEESASSQGSAGGAHWRVHYTGKDAEKYVKMAEEITGKTVKVVNDVVGQLSVQFDKAFSKFSNWFNSYEKSGEDEADYQRRQENAKVYREQKEAGSSADNTQGNSGSYRYNGVEQPEDETYLADCNGVLRKEEGIRNISIDAKSAEVTLYPSEDNQFRYVYKNHGSAGSKIVYRLDQRRTSDTLFLNIMKNEGVQRKNHFSILGGVFDETTDLELELWIPEWMNSVSCNGKSGDVKAENVKVRVLQLKSLSGDIEICGAQSAHCSAESSSGDVEVRKSSFEQLLAATKSGGSSGSYVQAQKAAFRTMSGDANVEFIDAEEVTVSSMSGDAKAENCKAEMLAVSSVSGDSSVERADSRNMKVSSTSGDVMVTECQTQNSIISTVSGDMDVPNLSAERLSAASTSGDISLRGSFNEMEVNNGSGDIIVVQQGDTRARINDRSGDVTFHLKNQNNGFVANLKTHGDISFAYNGLKLSDAASGEHRYGAEGSLLDFSLISGDIRITQ